MIAFCNEILQGSQEIPVCLNSINESIDFSFFLLSCNLHCAFDNNLFEFRKVLKKYTRWRIILFLDKKLFKDE